jgi:transposase
MGRAYSDDLRLRILEAYERGEGSCRVLAVRFGVSWEYVRKVRQQHVRSGHKKRLIQSRFGVRSRVTEQVRAHMLALVNSQADITIAELRERIEADKGVAMSWTLVQLWVKRLGLRLKKSRSTP